jgi:hypothetical protein
MATYSENQSIAISQGTITRNVPNGGGTNTYTVPVGRTFKVSGLDNFLQSGAFAVTVTFPDGRVIDTPPSTNFDYGEWGPGSVFTFTNGQILSINMHLFGVEYKNTP